MSAHLSNHHHKISDAIRVLNQVAQDKKTEVEKMVEDKYSKLREAWFEAARQGRKTLRRFGKVTEDAFNQKGNEFKGKAKELDKKIRKNPWPYIGAASASALALGVALGKSKKKN